MATLVLRNVKGSPLTNQEADDNFSNLNADLILKLDASEYTATDVVTKVKSIAVATADINVNRLNGLSAATANTISTVVARDSNGDFYAGTVHATAFIGNVTGNVTGSLSGNASTASTVTTNANLIGDVTSTGNTTTVVKINGTTLSGLATGILKNTTTTGVPSIAVAGDFPTLNQNTSGSAGSLSATLAIGSGGTGATTLAGASITTYTGSETLTNKILTNPTVTGYVESNVIIGVVGSTYTISLANGTMQTATLTSSTATVFTMPTATAGKSFVILLKQVASGPAGSATFLGVKWIALGAPIITTTVSSPSRMDIISFISDGTNWYGSYTQGFIL